MSYPDLHFVLNSHGLGFDRYSLVCIESLRRACGYGPRVSVYCPDNLPPPSDLALRSYERHEVDVRSFHNEFLPKRVQELNGVPGRWLTLNKVYTLADIPAGEKRVFLDADIVFLQDPTEYFQRITELAGASPVNTPEAFGGSWERLYRETGVSFPDETIEVWETYVYGKTPEPRKMRMPPYVSSGVVLADHRSSLPEAWLDLCRELEEKRELIPRTFFLDQVALSVALQKTGEPWHLIPREYNATYEIWPFIGNVRLFHYVTWDALAAGVARFDGLRPVMKQVLKKLSQEDGLDLRFQLLTEWPRLYRRGMGILQRSWSRLIGRPASRRPERT